MEKEARLFVFRSVGEEVLFKRWPRRGMLSFATIKYYLETPPQKYKNHAN